MKNQHTITTEKSAALLVAKKLFDQNGKSLPEFWDSLTFEQRVQCFKLVHDVKKVLDSEPDF